MFPNDNRYNNLKRSCKMINDNNIKNFKKNPHLIGIVENVSKKYGDDYLKNIIENFGADIDWDLIKKFNDLGDPKNLQFKIKEKYYYLSPTTLRYVQFTLEILEHMRVKNLQEVEVVEIGGGYGAQACMLYLLSKDINIKSYTILDLPEVNNLQNRFVKEWNSSLNIKCTTLENFTGNPNFLISNYALGEFNKETQDCYIDKIVKKLDHGFICWNFSPGNQKIHLHFDTIEKEIVEENPQTNCHPVKSYNIKF